MHLSRSQLVHRLRRPVLGLRSVGGAAEDLSRDLPRTASEAPDAVQLPVGKPGEWSYEPKFDGFRCIPSAAASGCGSSRASSGPSPGTSRRSQQRSAGWMSTSCSTGSSCCGTRPARLRSAAAASTSCRVPSRCPGPLDAGVVRRLRPARSRWRDLRRRPYLERRACLEDLLGRQLPHGLVLMPVSTDPAVAEQWLINHSAAGIEGVVAKRSCQSYRPGKTKWHKVRTRVTAEAVVGGVLGSLKHPEALGGRAAGSHGPVADRWTYHTPATGITP